MCSTQAVGRKHLKQLAFLDDTEYQYNTEDMLKVLNFEYNRVMILKVSLNFLYVYEEVDAACLMDFAKVFNFKRDEDSFSFRKYFITAHHCLIRSSKTSLKMEEGKEVTPKKSSRSSTAADDSVGTFRKGVVLTRELSPQVKKMLPFQSTHKVQPVCPPEEIGEPDPSLLSPHGPIWIPKQVHCNRYEDPEWKRVATILINAQGDHSRNWKHYAKLIGGGHPKSHFSFGLISSLKMNLALQTETRIERLTYR
jgi:hypothetical protein